MHSVSGDPYHARQRVKGCRQVSEFPSFGHVTQVRGFDFSKSPLSVQTICSFSSQQVPSGDPGWGLLMEIPGDE